MPRRVDVDRKRREIVAGAAAVFDRAGYHTTNVDALARAVGLKKPTLYHYFSSKDEILFWIHEEFIDLLIAQHEARDEQQLDPATSLRAAMADILRLMDTHRGHVRVFFEHHRELSRKHRRTITAKRDRYTALVQDDIQRGIDAGAFRKVDARLTTLAVFGMCNWAYQWYRSAGDRASTEIAELFWDLLIDGLRRRD